MESFFNAEQRQQLMQRLDKITAETKAQWGKMNAAQMLHHENNALHYILGVAEEKVKMTHNFFTRTFFKPMAYKGDMFPKSSPTIDEFKIDTSVQYNFDEEKKKVMANLKKIADEGEATVKNVVHPFFGKLTNEQWGKHISKHLNHHLKQFGL